ncbi:MAG: CpaF family protein [Armatimonadota bacterium]|nr:MAG: CpaF family protein [Armatimonadota bacterium]
MSVVTRQDDAKIYQVGEADADAVGGMTRQERLELVARVHGKLLEEVEPKKLRGLSRERMMDEIRGALERVVVEGVSPLSGRVRIRVLREVYDEVNGYGPIQPLIEDPSLTEIMVNGPEQVYAERDGKLFLTDIKFRDDAHVLRIIDRIVTPLGRRVDESSPMVDARLPDGSRVNAIIPPLSLVGPCINIRKFSRVPYTDEDLIAFGTMTPAMMAFLKACVKGRLNTIISGGTGSGKTTTLNVLSSFVPNIERIVTIEDAAELQLQQDHVVTLESRPRNLEGQGEITIRMLVRNALRMRPERIIVGEARGGEALDMLQAMNTGHDGSLSTAHTNSPRDTLARLETMVLMAGMELPARAIREQIASAMNLIVHQHRFSDGSRKVTHVSEIQGMEGDVIVLQDIFLYKQSGVDETGKVIGEHVATGLRPGFLPLLASKGIHLPADMFAPQGGKK